MDQCFQCGEYHYILTKHDKNYLCEDCIAKEESKLLRMTRPLTRACLKCDEEFNSVSKYNRLCSSCRKRVTNLLEGYDLKGF